MGALDSNLACPFPQVLAILSILWDEKCASVSQINKHKFKEWVETSPDIKLYLLQHMIQKCNISWKSSFPLSPLPFQITTECKGQESNTRGDLIWLRWQDRPFAFVLHRQKPSPDKRFPDWLPDFKPISSHHHQCGYQANIKSLQVRKTGYWDRDITPTVWTAKCGSGFWSSIYTALTA